MTPSDDVCRMAQNLARNCGIAVFPVGENKRPLLKAWPDHASTDPAAIAALWRTHPGPLIGIVTGSRSGISVVDIDIKHDAALWWWRDNNRRLLPTRTFRTRSGGLHLYFQHADGITNSQGKACAGVDTRGQGGYIIYWFAAGFACLDHTPPQPFPKWLLIELTKKPPPIPQSAREVPTETAIAGIVRRVETAKEGERNAVLFWAACRLFERGIRQGDAEATLLPAAARAGLASKAEQYEARRSIASAYRGRSAA
jgi:Bifunctional DNA primase/polymerase, N-terminal